MNCQYIKFIKATDLETSSHYIDSQRIDKKRLLISIIYPVSFVVIIWVVKIIELLFDVRFTQLGILPLNARGLPGIILSPFIHADFSHLISNSFPLLVLGSMLFYFYREVARTVLILSLLITGFWVWMLAREAWHIGASGIVYSLAAFLLTSGVIRKHPRLMALSLIVVFLYGGMVWGVLPLRDQVSWESHLMGMISGLLLAIHFRKYGPQRKLYSWELEELEQQQLDEEDEISDNFPEESPEELILKKPLNINENGHPEDQTLARIMKISYTYKPQSDSDESKKEGN